MKRFKEISFCLIFSLAVFTCCGKDLFSLFQKLSFTIEYASNQPSAANIVTLSSDASEDDVKYVIPSASMVPDTQSIERIATTSVPIPRNMAGCIWLPPKIA